MEATLIFTVTDDDTAVAVGSGSLAVLGTPRLLAWCEAATCAAIEPALSDGQTSVGTRVTLEHLAASPVGQRVEVTASSTYVDGRLHRFTVAARHVGDGGAGGDGGDGGAAGAAGAGGAGGAPGKVIGTGEVTRVVVDAERFLSRI